jgi:hypothetical protein
MIKIHLLEMVVVQVVKLSHYILAHLFLQFVSTNVEMVFWMLILDRYVITDLVQQKMVVQMIVKKSSVAGFAIVNMEKLINVGPFVGMGSEKIFKISLVVVMMEILSQKMVVHLIAQ